MTESFKYHLDAIRLRNFMGYKDTNWIELRSITLLFGRNSSGKSALIRALLLLKQSLTSRPQDIPLIFVGDMVDLGTFYNAVYGHDTTQRITFSFRIAMPVDLPLPDLPSNPTDDERKEFDADIARRQSTRAR